MHPTDRRRFILATAACGTLSACESWTWRAPEKGPLAAYLPDVADNDSQAAHRGLLRISERLRIPVEAQQSVGPTGLNEALRRMAASEATMVLAYGAEAAKALEEISHEFPKQRFSVVQAETNAPSLASYRVLHEQSAWLAGTAAGLLSSKKIIGHIGSARSDMQLNSRAAFYQGLRTAAPQAKFLSSFGGSDAELARLAAGQIAAGAEIIFHTLPGTDAALVTLARTRRIPLIGRGPDWLAQTQGVYIAAAFADPGVAAFQAGQDLYDGLWKSGLQRRIGVENPEAVRIVLADKTPPEIQQRVGLYRRELAAGGYRVVPAYDGPEFKL